MKKLFRICILIAIIVFFMVISFFLFGTDKSAGLVVCNSQNTEEQIIEENKFEFYPENGGKTVLNYAVSALEADVLYDFEMNFSIQKGSYFQQKDDIAISLNTETDYDINGKYTRSVTENKDDIYTIHHIFMPDKEGKSEFELSIGSDDNLFFGKIKLESLKIQNVEKSADLKVLYSENHSVCFVFNSNDFYEYTSIKQNCKNYLENCELLKNYLCDFSDSGNDGVVFVFNENIPHTGISGQLIYINNSETEQLFSQEISNKASLNSFMSILCHEMSHKFDYDANFENTFEYCFDKEFFTILRQMYAFSEAGYEIDYEYLGDTECLSNNIYNYQEFLKEFLISVDVFKDKNNWNYIVDTLNKHSKVNNSISDMDKVNLLISETSDACGYNIIDKIDAKKYETIINHFSVEEAENP